MSGCRRWPPGFRCLRRPAADATTLFPGVLLLLSACMSECLAGAGKHPPAGSSEDEGNRLRSLWRFHMRDKLKGKGVPLHPIRGVFKHQLLYCRVGIGYHLQILPNGSVGGIHNPTENCFLKVFAVKHGVVGVRAVRSGLYLCMSGEGVAYGAERFSDDCLFKENLEENHYTTYSSLSHPGVYLALSHKGEVKRGTNVSRHQPCTHFLPRQAT
ncbi:fibroblast growth factor 4A-like [Polymixia lowei]